MELVGNFVTTGATSLKAAIKAWAKKALLNFQKRSTTQSRLVHTTEYVR